MCPHCPRGMYPSSHHTNLATDFHGVFLVFHAECFGVSLSDLRLKCRQHACATCGRSTTDSGGMLFRYKTPLHLTLQ